MQTREQSGFDEPTLSAGANPVAGVPVMTLTDISGVPAGARACPGTRTRARSPVLRLGTRSLTRYWDTGVLLLGVIPMVLHGAVFRNLGFEEADVTAPPGWEDAETYRLPTSQLLAGWSVDYQYLPGDPAWEGPDAWVHYNGRYLSGSAVIVWDRDRPVSDPFRTQWPPAVPPAAIGRFWVELFYDGPQGGCCGHPFQLPPRIWQTARVPADATWLYFRLATSSEGTVIVSLGGQRLTVLPAAAPGLMFPYSD